MLDDILDDHMDALDSAATSLGSEVAAAAGVVAPSTLLVRGEDLAQARALLQAEERLREDEARYGREQAEDLARMRAIAPRVRARATSDMGALMNTSVRFVNSWGGWGHPMSNGVAPWPEVRTHEVKEEPPKVEPAPVEPTKTKRRLNF